MFHIPKFYFYFNWMTYLKFPPFGPFYVENGNSYIRMPLHFYERHFPKELIKKTTSKSNEK